MRGKQKSWEDNINPIAFRQAKIVCNFGLSECSRVKGLKSGQKQT